MLHQLGVPAVVAAANQLLDYYMANNSYAVSQSFCETILRSRVRNEHLKSLRFALCSALLIPQNNQITSCCGGNAFTETNVKQFFTDIKCHFLCLMTSASLLSILNIFQVTLYQTKMTYLCLNKQRNKIIN